VERPGVKMPQKTCVRQGSGQKEKPPEGLEWYELFGEVPQVLIAFSPCRSCGAGSLPAGVGDQVCALELAKG